MDDSESAPQDLFSGLIHITSQLKLELISEFAALVQRFVPV